MLAQARQRVTRLTEIPGRKLHSRKPQQQRRVMLEHAAQSLRAYLNGARELAALEQLFCEPSPRVDIARNLHRRARLPQLFVRVQHAFHVR